MKKTVGSALCVGILTSLLPLSAYTNQVCSQLGAITNCGPGTLDELFVSGKATLNGTKITGNTHISGVLRALSVDLNNLEVSGTVSLTKSKVNGITKIRGLMASCGTRFNKKIVITSNRTHFDNSETKDMEVNSEDSSQVVYLRNKTVVKGNITFSSNHGLVVIDETSKIGGRIFGGNIKNGNIETFCEGDK